MSFSKLSADVVHEILTFLPDFTSLSACLRTSTIFYDTFQARPESIVRAILSNTFGEAELSAALMAQHCDGLPDSRDEDTFLREERSFVDLPVGDLRLAQDLVTRGLVVRRLEDHFSFKCAFSPQQNL